MRQSPLAFIALLLILLYGGAAEATINPKKRYPVTWEVVDGKISTTSVCGDHARSTIAYRECRSYAVDLFKLKCRDHTRRFEGADGKRRVEEREKMELFCSASYRFSP